MSNLGFLAVMVALTETDEAGRQADFYVWEEEMN